MIIENDEEHALLLSMLDDLMKERLSKAIEAYEKTHFPMPRPTPEEALAFRAGEEPGRVLKVICGPALEPRARELFPHVPIEVRQSLGAGDWSVVTGKSVCARKGHVPIEKMSAIICDRCGLVLHER